jgi:hypothetical protein
MTADTATDASPAPRGASVALPVTSRVRFPTSLQLQAEAHRLRLDALHLALWGRAPRAPSDWAGPALVFRGDAELSPAQASARALREALGL